MGICTTRGGKPKVCHSTRDEAESHRLRHQKTTNVRVDVYRCPKCSQWHVGRSRGTAKQLLRHWKHERDTVGKLIPILRNIIEHKG